MKMIIKVALIIIFAVFLCGGIQPQRAKSIALAAVGDSQVITFSAEPAGACQDCIWTLEIDEDKMTSFVVRHLKDKNIEDYIQLEVLDGHTVKVTALQYFRYGIKYKTYYTLTATSLENETLSATCSIQLG